MGRLLNAYSISYVLIPKQGNKRWIINSQVAVLGSDLEDAVKNARPLFEQEQALRGERSRLLGRNFTGYGIEIKLIRRIPFYLPSLAREERLIPAFNYLGKGIFSD